MSDAEVAHRLAGACSDACLAEQRGDHPLPLVSFNDEAPVWRELSEAITPRVEDLAGAAGVTLPRFEWRGMPSDERLAALEQLRVASYAVCDHFRDLERTDPKRHAIDSLRRLRDEIPVLRDQSTEQFLHRVKRTFPQEGSVEKLRPYYESVAELARVLGVSRPQAWRPNLIPDWAAWHDEWERLAAFCTAALSAVNDAAPKGQAIEAKSNGREASPLYQAIRDLKAKGIATTPGQIVAHIATVDGNQLREMVAEELKKQPRTRTKPPRERRVLDVVLAALKSTYSSQKSKP